MLAHHDKMQIIEEKMANKHKVGRTKGLRGTMEFYQIGTVLRIFKIHRNIVITARILSA